MAKIMEILEIKPDYKGNKAKIKMGDTAFASFTKSFNSVPGQTTYSVVSNDYVGYEAIHDLYSKQKGFFDRLETFKNACNTFATTKSNQYGRATIPTFAPGLALEDYRNDFSEGSETSYTQLTKFIQGEKDIYKYTRDADTYLTNLQTYFKEWSKSRWYTTCIKTYKSRQFDLKYGSTWRIRSNNYPGVGATLELSGGDGSNHWDRCKIVLNDVSAIPINGTLRIWLEGSRYDSAADCDIIWYLTRRSCGTNIDDGYFTTGYYEIDSDANSLFQKTNDADKTTAYTGNHSIHFDYTGVPPLSWFQERKINV